MRGVRNLHAPLLKPTTPHAYFLAIGLGKSLGPIWKGRTLSIATTSRAVRRHPDPGPTVRPQAGQALRLVLASLDDMKAEDTVSIDLAGKSTIGDFMVVASGRSNRHVGAVASRVVEDLEKAGMRGLRVAGMPHCDWVLIDAGDVIVHVFRPEVRAFYNIEKMWMSGVAEPQRSN